MTAIERLGQLNQQFARLEQIPLKPTVLATDNVPIDLPAPTTYEQLVKDARQTRLELVFERATDEPNAQVAEQLFRLERQEMALLYRSNAPKPETRPFDILQRELRAVIERYKKNPDIYPGGNGQLTDHDKAQIDIVCRDFPVFAETLIRRSSSQGERNDDVWTMGFVKFCLRSPERSGQDASEWPEIFITLPNETDMLMGSMLDKRFGAVDPKLIGIVAQADGARALSMKMDGAWVRVQGPKNHAVPLRNRIKNEAPAYSLTVANIYKQMRDKRASYENIEVMANLGITNWHTLKLGSFNPTTHEIDQIDVKQKDWIHQFPAWRVLSEEELHRLYPHRLHWSQETPHHHRFALMMCATRSNANLDISDNHGFIQLIFPDPVEPGKFRVLPLGFQPTRMPSNALEKLFYLESTQSCLVHGPDESGVRSDRQLFTEATILSPQEWQEQLDHFAHFITEARAGRRVFQPTGDNCGTHAQEVYDAVIGKRFYKPFQSFAESLFPERNIEEELFKITRNLDDAALSSLSQDIATALTDPTKRADMGNRDQIAELMSLCLNTLSQVLKDGPTSITDLQLTPEALRQKIDALYASNPEAAEATLKNDLTKLIRMTIESQQFYKMSFYDAELHADYIGPLFNYIRTIRWEFLRWLLMWVVLAILFVVASPKTHSFQTLEGEMVTKCAVSHDFHARVLNLPAKAFERTREQVKQRDEAFSILQHLTNSPA